MGSASGVSAEGKLRVAFDTNVVVTALLFTRGRLSSLVDQWQAQKCVPLVSRPTAIELTRALAYSKFGLTAEEQFEALGSYMPFCDVVPIATYCPVPCRDSKDQIFLDLAESGHADVIVTGDEDLLALAALTEFAMRTPEDHRRTWFES